MKTKISELMDGELGSREAAAPLDALRSEGEARETWRSYHLIGDAMRDTRMLSAGFASRVSARLAQEPTVIAPGRLAALPQRPRWQFLSAAASLAAVALVGWMAFGPATTAPRSHRSRRVRRRRQCPRWRRKCRRPRPRMTTFTPTRASRRAIRCRAWRLTFGWSRV